MKLIFSSEITAFCILSVFIAAPSSIDCLPVAVNKNSNSARQPIFHLGSIPNSPELFPVTSSASSSAVPVLVVHSPSDEIDNLELSFDEMHFSPLQRPLLSPSLYNSDIDENDPMFVPPLNLGESQFHRRRERYSSSPLPHSSYNSGHSPAGTDTSFASSPGGGFNVVHMMMYTRSEITDSVPALYRALNESEDVKLSEKFSLDSLKTVWLNYFSLSYNKALQSDIILEQISNFNVEIVAAATAFNALQQKKIVGVEIEKAKLKSLIHDLFGFTGDEESLADFEECAGLFERLRPVSASV